MIKIYVNDNDLSIIKDENIEKKNKERRIDAFIPYNLWIMFDNCKRKLGLSIKAFLVKCIANYLCGHGYDEAREWF